MEKAQIEAERRILRNRRHFLRIAKENHEAQLLKIKQELGDINYKLRQAPFASGDMGGVF